MRAVTADIGMRTMGMRNICCILTVVFCAEILQAQSFMERGMASLEQGDLKQAVRWFDWGIAADSTDAARYAFRGRAKRERDNRDAAIRDLRKAILLDPKMGDAYFFLALCLYETGDHSGSVESNTLALKNATYYRSQAFLNRAKTYVTLGKTDLAMKDLGSVIALKDANAATAYLERGKLKMRLNDRKGALMDFKVLAELRSEDAQLRWDIGRISYEVEEFADAVTYYSRAMEMVEEKDPQLYMIRGEAFERLEHYEAAIADYSAAIGLDTKLAQAYYSRGQAKARSGDKKAACSDWKKAGELGHEEAKGVIVYNCE